jgi:hypothetical protein
MQIDAKLVIGIEMLKVLLHLIMSKRSLLAEKGQVP